MLRFVRRLQRKDAIAEPMPEAWRREVERVVPLSRHLEDAERDKLEALVRIFLAEKTFEAAGGLELTEEMCAAIAARACILVLRRAELDDPLYPDLDSIVVYPGAYRAKATRVDGHLHVESDEVRLGESWSRGTIVLAWSSAEEGARREHDGHDVVLHEFAHQLDAEDGDMDGAPALGSGARYRSWAKTLAPVYEDLVARVRAGEPTPIDPYGATNPAEFFAVITEAFFETPRRLRRLEPALYRELVGYFGMDPVEICNAPARARTRDDSGDP